MSSCSCKGKKHGGDCCFSCCFEKESVQDKLCCDFTVTAAAVTSGTQPFNTLFATDVTVSCENLVASGTIKNCGPGTLTVQFVRGASIETGLGGTIVRTLVIPPGGCALFTVARFDTIRAFGAAGTSSSNPTSGELCLTPRYRI